MKPINDLTAILVDEAIHVHRTIGPGMLESAYVRALAHRLRQRRLAVLTEVTLGFAFEDLYIPDAFRVDILVEDRVPIEVKSLGRLARIHYCQLRTYLRAGGWEVGLLMNFGEERLVDGLQRVNNGAPML